MAKSIYTVHTALIKGVTIEGINQSSASPGFNVLRVQTDGRVNPAASTVMGQQASMSLTSIDLKAAIDGLGLTGLSFASSDTATFYMQQRADGGGISAGSTHRKALMNKGLAVINSIQASQGQEATVNIMVYVDGDGTNEPFVLSDSVAVPAYAAGREVWTLGPVELNGTLVEGIQSVNVDFGNVPMRITSDGQVINDFTSLDQAPVVNIETNDLASFDAFTQAGEAIASTVEIWFRKKAIGGGNVADATATHIKLTINAGMITPADFSGSQGAPYTNNLQITADDDDSNDPIVFATTSAIA